MPSHVQIARVLDGGLDAAIAWVPAADDRLDLQFLWAEPLSAATPARNPYTGGDAVAAGELRVLVDTDLTSWDAWNRYAADFAQAAGCRIVHIDDGGITGLGFHHHCQRLDAPVLVSPKRHPAPLPAGLRIRAVRDPTPLWCWSLVTRAADDRPAVLALRVNAARITRAAGLHVVPNAVTWVPAGDPHRERVASLVVA